MRKHLANCLTISRGIAALFLLVLPVFGGAFWSVYVWCGLSDMLDGAIARKTGSVSREGAVLDSIADLVFVGICLIKILPELELPMWMWIWLIIIALIKMFNFIRGILCHHQIIMPHTQTNKVTGFLLFLLPLALQWISPLVPSLLVCIVATYAAIEEGIDTNRG